MDTEAIRVMRLAIPRKIFRLNNQDELTVNAQVIMKDSLEEFVKNNREALDIHDVDPGLWNRIKPSQKLTATTRQKVLKISYRVAAGLAIFLLSYAFHEFRSIRKKDTLMLSQSEALYMAIPELKETEVYYSALVNTKLEELEPYFVSEPELQVEINHDLSELDSVYSSLKQDLLENISNEQVIEAMIQNYRLKIDILEDLLQEFSHKSNASTGMRSL